MISRHSSGSRWLAISVEPTRSQKSTVRWQRSPAISSLTSWRDSTDAAAGVETLSGAPQSLQNFAPGLLFAPQRRHFATIGEAHSLQNFAPSGFSAEQFW